MRRDLRVRSRRAEAGVLAVDDVRLHGALRFVADAHAIADVGDEAVDEHVGCRDETEEDLPALLAAEIEREAPLVLVHLQVRRAVAGRELPEEVTDVVALPRRLDLDHVGAEVAEDHADGVAVEEHGRLEHANAFEEPHHRYTYGAKIGVANKPGGAAMTGSIARITTALIIS